MTADVDTQQHVIRCAECGSNLLFKASGNICHKVWCSEVKKREHSAAIQHYFLNPINGE